MRLASTFGYWNKGSRSKKGGQQCNQRFPPGAEQQDVQRPSPNKRKKKKQHKSRRVSANSSYNIEEEFENLGLAEAPMPGPWVPVNTEKDGIVPSSEELLSIATEDKKWQEYWSQHGHFLAWKSWIEMYPQHSNIQQLLPSFDGTLSGVGDVSEDSDALSLKQLWEEHYTQQYWFYFQQYQSWFAPETLNSPTCSNGSELEEIEASHVEEGENLLEGLVKGQDGYEIDDAINVCHEGTDSSHTDEADTQCKKCVEQQDGHEIEDSSTVDIGTAREVGEIEDREVLSDDQVEMVDEQIIVEDIHLLDPDELSHQNNENDPGQEVKNGNYCLYSNGYHNQCPYYR